MKITELVNCLAIMKECYSFDNDKTEIMIGSPIEGYGHGRKVEICTTDENGTQVNLSRYADELNEVQHGE